jgi:amylosucrase
MEVDAREAVERILLAHSVAFSTGGIPLLYLGDEVGQVNDYSYASEPGHESDSRWVHRPHFPEKKYEHRLDPSTPEGAVYAGLRRMIQVRAAAPELAGTGLIDFATHNPGVLAYQRPGGSTRILALANFSDEPQALPAETFSGYAAAAVDLLSEAVLRLDDGVTLLPRQYVWLRVTPL